MNGRKSPPSPARQRRPKGNWDISVHADEIYAPEAGLEPGLALLRNSGINYTDLRVVNGRDSFIRLGDAELDGIRKLLKKYAIKVGALETPVFKCPLRANNAINWGHSPGFSDDMTFQDHLWLLNRAFEIADRFDTENVRCFSFWREYELDDAFDEVVEKLGAAARLAEAAGRRVYLQNEQDTFAGTGVELARILKAVGSPNLLAAYDLGNSARLGGVAYPDDYGALRGLLGHVQIKFQSIDIRCGWGLPDPDLTGPVNPCFPFYFWQQSDLPISGWIQIGSQRIDLGGPRTFLPAGEMVGLDLRSFLKELKKDGYGGLIAVDTSYFIHGAGSTSHAEIEANFAKTLSSLRTLIAGI